MPTIKIDLDADRFYRLMELAVEERRPIAWEAEVLLCRAIGLPCASAPEETQPKPYRRGRATKEKDEAGIVE